ncbi:MAG TPA: hypothetical protein VEG34_10765, partial [Thermoanaerobaculia bacterium]|nr:hypothetical protein [Thermoanaerobaculia bacterium]
AQQRLDPPLRLTAFAVNLGVTPDARPRGQSGTVIINIDRWSNPAERAALLQAFRDKGPDGLRAALLETKRVGNIRTPDSIGWPLHYAHMVPAEDGGTQIFLATERRIAFWEAASNARTLDYPFTLVEIRIGPDGEGEGRLSLATKVTLSQDGTNLRLENYASEPVRLQSVRLDK